MSRLIKYQVTCPSRFSPISKAHNAWCKYYDNSHGTRMTLKEIEAADFDVNDCGLCSGRSGETERKARKRR